MTATLLQALAEWSAIDSWIVIVAALAAMACALPGNYLVLRRQSMMGDALSHTVLLGIVVAFLFAQRLVSAGLISLDTYAATRHAIMFAGAMLIGVLSAVLTEWVQKLGRVEASAALGVVFTTVFALGLLLLRVAADKVDIDPDCVLYGTIETTVIDTLGSTGIPRAAVVNGAMLAINLALVVAFYKELRISTFDPALATTLGIHSGAIHYALMAVTATTLVAAFESVGSILVIAMLIVPAAAAHLLTDRLWVMILLSLLIAAASALSGHLMAIAVPQMVLDSLGIETIKNVSASTAGMMAVAAGILFALAALLGPRYGVISRLVSQMRMSLRIVSEDILGFLYRLEEPRRAADNPDVGDLLAQTLGVGRLLKVLAVARLRWQGQLAIDANGYHLTPAGRAAAEQLVRSHRLFESYMARHFDVPDDHLHETASRVEHYIGSDLREELATELDRPRHDPHGRLIPPETRPHDQNP